MEKDKDNLRGAHIDWIDLMALGIVLFVMALWGTPVYKETAFTGACIFGFALVKGIVIMWNAAAARHKASLEDPEKK